MKLIGLFKIKFTFHQYITVLFITDYIQCVKLDKYFLTTHSLSFDILLPLPQNLKL